MTWMRWLPRSKPPDAEGIPSPSDEDRLRPSERSMSDRSLPPFERGVELLLLVEMESEYRVETVERPT